MPKLLGAHTIENGGIHMAVRRAANAGMTAMQLFTAIPKFYGDKSNIKPERVTRFKAALAESKIKPEAVVVHAAYVLSVATPDDDKWARASAGLTKELERSSKLGVGQVCFHPGSARTSEPSASAKRIARAITVALETIDSSTRASHREHRRRRAHHGPYRRGDRMDAFGMCRSRSARAQATVSTPVTSSARATTSRNRRRTSRRYWTSSRRKQESLRRSST